MFGFTNAAIYAPLKDMTSIDTKNTFPVQRCAREPFRKNNAAYPNTNPTIAPKMCKTKIGEYFIPPFLFIRGKLSSRFCSGRLPRRAFLPALLGCSGAAPLWCSRVRVLTSPLRLCHPACPDLRGDRSDPAFSFVLARRRQAVVWRSGSRSGGILARFRTYETRQDSLRTPSPFIKRSLPPPPRLPHTQLLQHQHSIPILRIHLQRFFIIRNRQRLITVIHIALRQAVVNIPRPRISFHVQLKNTNRILELVVSDQLITQRIQFVFVKVVSSTRRGLQRVILLNRLVNPARRNSRRQNLRNRFAAVVRGFDLRN